MGFNSAFKGLKHQNLLSGFPAQFNSRHLIMRTKLLDSRYRVRMEFMSCIIRAPFWRAMVRGSCRKERRGRRCEDFLAVSSFSSVRAALAAPNAMRYTYICFKPAYPAQNRFTCWKPHDKWRTLFRNKNEQLRFDVLYILHRFTVGEQVLKWHDINSYSPCELYTQHPLPTLSNTKLPSEMCQSSLRHPL